MPDPDRWTDDQATIEAYAFLRRYLIELGGADGTRRRAELLQELFAAGRLGHRSIIDLAWQDRNFYDLAADMVGGSIEAVRLIASGKVVYPGEGALVSIRRILADPILAEFAPAALERAKAVRKRGRPEKGSVDPDQAHADAVRAALGQLQQAAGAGLDQVRTVFDQVPVLAEALPALEKSARRPGAPAAVGNNPWHSELRDIVIAEAVRIVAQHGFRATRNDATTDKRSACDIVARALEGLGFPISYHTVRDIYVREQRAEAPHHTA